LAKVKTFGKPEGEWFDFMVVKDAQGKVLETVRVKLRSIPNDEGIKMEVEELGEEQAVIYRKNRREVHIRPGEHMRLSIRRCLYAWVETENWEVAVPDVEGPKEILLRLNPAAAIGDLVKLDGKWTDELRHLMLDSDDTLREWVRERIEKIGRAIIQEEQGKG
jgi:hypothetical protein